MTPGRRLLVVVAFLAVSSAGALSAVDSASGNRGLRAVVTTSSRVDPVALRRAVAALGRARAVLVSSKSASAQVRRAGLLQARSKVDAAETELLDAQQRLGGPGAGPGALGDLVAKGAAVQGAIGSALFLVDLKLQTQGGQTSVSSTGTPASSLRADGIKQGYSPPPGPPPTNGPAPSGSGSSSATIISTPPYSAQGPGLVGIPTLPPDPNNAGKTLCQTSPSACSARPNNVLTFGSAVILAQDAIVGTMVAGGTRTYIVCVEVAYSDTPHGPVDNNDIIYGTGSNCSYGSQDVAWYGQAGIWPAVIPSSCVAQRSACVVGIPSPNAWTGFYGGTNTITFPYRRGDSETEQAGGWNAQAIHQFTYTAAYDNRWTYFSSDCVGQGDPGGNSSYQGSNPIVNCATFSLPFAFVPNASTSDLIGYIGSVVDQINREIAALQASPPQNTQPPTITGPAVAGDYVTAEGDSWSGSPAPTTSYQWERCDASGANCVSISGATGDGYLLATADIGSTIRILETATNSAGSASATSSPSDVVGSATPPANTSAPTISGTSTVGSTLTANVGTWSGSVPINFGYRWEDCDPSGATCTPIVGATDSTYTLAASDAQQAIIVVVSGNNDAGTSTATSAPTAPVSPSANAASTPDANDVQAATSDTVAAESADPTTPLAPPVGPANVSDSPPSDGGIPDSGLQLPSGVATVALRSAAPNGAPASEGTVIGYCNIDPGSVAYNRYKGVWRVAWGANTDCSPEVLNMFGVAVLKRGKFTPGSPATKGAQYPTSQPGNVYSGFMSKGRSGNFYREPNRVDHFIHHNSYVLAPPGESWGVPGSFVQVSRDTECRQYFNTQGQDVLHCISNTLTEH